MIILDSKKCSWPNQSSNSTSLQAFMQCTVTYKQKSFIFSHKIHIFSFENTCEQGLLQLRLSHQKTMLPQIIDMRKGRGYENK